jgi:hypothetical protein
MAQTLLVPSICNLVFAAPVVLREVRDTGNDVSERRRGTPQHLRNIRRRCRTNHLHMTRIRCPRTRRGLRFCRVRHLRPTYHL